MRRAAKVDSNHGEVVEALRSAGASVQSLAAIGRGCPDLLVGYRGMWLLFEVKDGARSPSRRKLTPDQEKWIKASRGGPVWLITSLPEAIQALEQTSFATPPGNPVLHEETSPVSTSPPVTGT